MSVTAAGRKIVAISSVNSRLRPGNRNRAKPYATSVHESTVPIVADDREGNGVEAAGAGSR